MESNETKTDQPGDQESTVPDRYKGILDESALDEAAKDAGVADQPNEESGKTDENDQSTQTDEEKSEKTDEKKEEKTDESDDDEEVVYEQDKITFKKGKDSRELVRVSFKNDKGEEEFGYLPEGVKAGFLKDADYTQKTQQLKEESKQVEATKKALEALEYVDILGRIPEERPRLPRLNEDFLNAEVTDKEGYKSPKYETEDEARQAYAQAVEKYNKDVQNYDSLMSDKRTLDEQRKSNREKNTAMINAFRDEYGEDATKEVLAVAGKYINPLKFRELEAYESNSLKVLYLGLNHEKLKEEAVKEAVKKALADIDPKAKKTTVLKGRKPDTPITRNEQIPDRYAFLDQEN